MYIELNKERLGKHHIWSKQTRRNLILQLDTWIVGIGFVGILTGRCTSGWYSVNGSIVFLYVATNFSFSCKYEPNSGKLYRDQLTEVSRKMLHNTNTISVLNAIWPFQ